MPQLDMPYATHISRYEGSMWEPLDPASQLIKVLDLCDKPVGKGQPYIAYEFSDGWIWDSIVGWRSSPARAKPSETVFAEAEKIIYGDREETYGHPAKNLENIAQQWKTYLHQKYGTMIMLDTEDVCWMMADLKKCRQMNSSKRDNLVDAIGYIGLIERCE